MAPTCRHVVRAFCAVALLCLAVLMPISAAQAQDGASQAPQDAPGAAAALTDAPLGSLIEVLRDEAARDRLLQALEAAATGDTPSPDDGAAAPAPVEDRAPSLGTRVAETTQEVAEGIVTQIDSARRALTTGGGNFRGLSGQELTVLLESLQSLAVVIAITVAVFFGLRVVLKPVFAGMGRRAAEANIVRKALLYVGSLLLDVGVVLVAWAIGYAITLLLLGDYAQIGFRQALYLNAFLLVELAKVAIRAILSPSTGDLRLIALADKVARRLDRHAALIVSILGYGQLLVVPIVNRNASYTAGLGMSALLSLIVVIYLIVLVIRHRDGVANWIAERLTEGDYTAEPDVPSKKRLGGPIGTLVRSWHWFALAYLAFMLVVVPTQPARVVVGAITASAQVVGVVLAGSLLIGAIGIWLRKGIVLPDGLRARLPLLEPRINRIVPRVLRAIRVLIGIAVVGWSIDIMGLANVAGWLGSEVGLDLSGRIVSVALIFLVAALLLLALDSWVDYQLNPEFGQPPSSRQTTLLTLLRSAATIMLLVLTLMFALSEIGLDIGPLIASAGVLGLAIGFGAQKLVQDIITGIFIQLDNAMNVGDVVTVGATTGVVEKLTVRSVSIRDVAGTYHIVPFSSVDQVSNFMRDFAYTVCDMGIAYREDIAEARTAMEEGFKELLADEAVRDDIIGELEWFGLNAFADSAVILRARIKTRPGKQWSTGRAYNAILKRVFDERGIEIPFPHQTIYFGEAKDGRTQPLRVEQRSDAPDADPQTG